jgi:hypothetical protein
MRIIWLPNTACPAERSHMEITCYRNHEVAREPRQLPAPTYNSALLLLEHSKDGVVFVPIRGMQYLAVIDREEIIFLDSEHRSWVAIAWQNFRPQQRTALTDAVPYEAAYYTQAAREAMKRLLAEFPQAVKALAARDTPSTGARIIKLDRSRPGN